MGNSSYFRFDDDNKTKYIYSLNHQKEMSKLKTHSPRIVWWITERICLILLTHSTKYIWQAFQCFEISLHNDDNEMVWWTKKRISHIYIYIYIWSILTLVLFQHTNNILSYQRLFGCLGLSHAIRFKMIHHKFIGSGSLSLSLYYRYLNYFCHSQSDKFQKINSDSKSLWLPIPL